MKNNRDYILKGFKVVRKVKNKLYFGGLGSLRGKDILIFI